MIGNQINLFFQEGTQQTVGASLVIVLSVLLAVLMSYYLWIDRARVGGDEGVAAVRRVRDWFANPWGQPRALAAITWPTWSWSIVPVLIAILFSFNDGRSRSVWQGFSTRWCWGDPNQSVFHDPALREAPSSRASGSPGSTC